MLESLEGKRGMPRLKPPFPAQCGYNNQPSNINNVETFANVAWIINNGGEKFAALGTEGSKGTKVFALTGKVKRGGLVEIPMGMTLREIIFDIGGGIRKNKKFKAVQIGGPSGGCLPAALLNTPIDYKALNATGAIMGSGGMVVMDSSTCMVKIAKFFLDFTEKESCGKCTHCRLGTKKMLEILTRITDGKAREGDIWLLEELCYAVIDGSLCGLGQSAPNPVLTTLKYFRDEYEAHVFDKKCPAKECTNLLVYTILPHKCTGCTLCVRKCPTNAIHLETYIEYQESPSGDRKASAGAVHKEIEKVYTIDQNACIKCGLCKDLCRFSAIGIEGGNGHADN